LPPNKVTRSRESASAQIVPTAGQLQMNPRQLGDATYLGDGVYVSQDGYHVWLYTDNGIRVSNKIALDARVLEAFDEWRKSTNNKQKGKSHNDTRRVRGQGV
jgi:hypothetical protein